MTSSQDPDSDTRRLSARSLAAGDPTGWFESLYAEAAQGSATVPWDRGAPNALLVDWCSRTSLDGTGRRALVVGCGLGRDSEYLATLGFDVTAFDISPTAIDGARARHPQTAVHYEVADLLALPDRYRGHFDFVLESHNVQALPDPPRAAAIEAVTSTVASRGLLLVLAFAGEEDTVVDGPPWPLTPREIESFGGGRLERERVDVVGEGDESRWRAEFTRRARW